VKFKYHHQTQFFNDFINNEFEISLMKIKID